MGVTRWLLLVTCIGLGGCASIAAHYIETPGHHGPRPQIEHWLTTSTDYTLHDFHTAAGLRIAYWYSPPTRLDIKPAFKESREGSGFTFSFQMHVAKAGHDSPPPPTRGSVVLLHPWGQNALQMAFWGVYFSNAGYVTVLPALRSQGDSGNAPVGYGPREAGDTMQLIQYLRNHGKLPPPLYLFGVSYGATVALFAASQLPDLRGVIALEPYVHPVDVIERAPRSNLFDPPWWPHWLGRKRLSYLFGPDIMRKAIVKADKDLGIDLASIDPGNALAASHACTLLLRGSHDILISANAMRDLAARSPLANYVEIPHEGHMTLFFRSDLLFDPILKWMQDVSPNASASCPDLEYKATASTLGEVRPTHRSSSRNRAATSVTQ